MSIINYSDATITNWEVDDNGNRVSVMILNERQRVVGNKFVLMGLPDIQHRVIIDGFVEIGIDEKIEKVNQFKVDYKKFGVVFVHPSKDGEWIDIDRYYSRGLIHTPASRVWTKLSVDGKVIETMDGAFDELDSQSSDIANLSSTRIYEGSVKPVDTKFWYDPSDD